MNYRNESIKFHQKTWSKMTNKLLDQENRNSGWLSIKPSKEFPVFIEYLKKEKILGSSLDIGCGAGRHTFALANYGTESYGIDFSKGAIDTAKRYNISKTNFYNKKFSNIHFDIGDALDLTFNDDYFDVINDDGCLHHIDFNLWEIYRENICKVLKQRATYRLKAISKNCRMYEEGEKIANGVILVKSEKWEGVNPTFFSTVESISSFLKPFFEIIELNEIPHEKDIRKRMIIGVFKKI